MAEQKGKSPRPLVMAGPSGVGKSTLIRLLNKECGEEAFAFSVSHTTRNPRPGEVDGKDYHFATKDWMEKAIAEGRFVESANVHGNLYGTSKAALQAVQSQGKICILDVDMQGVLSIKKTDIDAFYIFVLPPSFDALETRLRSRGTESEETIARRLATAKTELPYAEKQPELFDALLVNDDLNKCMEDFKEIMFKEYPWLKE